MAARRGSPSPSRPNSEVVDAIARDVRSRLGDAEIEIWYRYGTGGRRLRVFPGGWWDSEVRRDHEGERGPRA